MSCTSLIGDITFRAAFVRHQSILKNTLNTLVKSFSFPYISKHIQSRNFWLTIILRRKHHFHYENAGLVFFLMHQNDFTRVLPCDQYSHFNLNACHSLELPWLGHFIWKFVLLTTPEISTLQLKSTAAVKYELNLVNDSRFRELELGLHFGLTSHQYQTL